MLHKLKYHRLAWLGIGLVAGLILGGLLPESPLHAVATDRSDTYAIATGPIDEETEGIFFLDQLTGNLGVAVIDQFGNFVGSPPGPNLGTPLTMRPVLQDFNVNPAQNPRFLMVTGMTRLQRAAGAIHRSRSIVFIMEVTTGKLGAYVFTWQGAGTVNGIRRGTILPVGAVRVRPAAAGAVPGR